MRRPQRDRSPTGPRGGQGRHPRSGCRPRPPRARPPAPSGTLRDRATCTRIGRVLMHLCCQARLLKCAGPWLLRRALPNQHRGSNSGCQFVAIALRILSRYGKGRAGETRAVQRTRGSGSAAAMWSWARARRRPRPAAGRPGHPPRSPAPGAAPGPPPRRGSQAALAQPGRPAALPPSRAARAPPTQAPRPPAPPPVLPRRPPPPLATGPPAAQAQQAAGPAPARPRAPAAPPRRRKRRSGPPAAPGRARAWSAAQRSASPG